MLIEAESLPVESTALAVIPATAVSTIVAADTNDILGKLAAKVSAHRADISTPKGRKDIASLAAEVASSKMDLIRLGKSLTEGWRASVAAVNAECKVIEERMDDLKEKVRRPLTDFENREKARVAGHEAALARLAVDPSMERATSDQLRDAIRARQEPEARNWEEFHERAIAAHRGAIAVLSGWRSAALDSEAEAAELARLRAEAAEHERQRIAQEQAEREAQIAAQAADRARLAAEADAQRQAQGAADAAARAIRETEAKAAADLAAAERRAADEREAGARREREAQEQAQAAAVAAERERIAAAQREDTARRRAEAAEQMATAAKEQAARDAEAAVVAERKRVADARAAEEAEAAKRAANVAHKKRINNEILAALSGLGVADQEARAIITSMARGAIPHVSISY